MRETKKIAGSQLEAIIDQMVNAIAQRHCHTQGLALAGIANGGLVLGRLLAARLTEQLGRPIACGTVNIVFQRDDIGRKPIPLDAENTDFPFDVNDATVILVDDVFFSGRTARAAMNEVFDQGRPIELELAVFCDRGHHKLPIHPDYIGITVETFPQSKVVLQLDEAHPEEGALRIFEP